MIKLLNAGIPDVDNCVAILEYFVVLLMVVQKLNA